jgi:methylmalonyl-CoA/ethylmalonyl-CoA epimerase
MSTVIAPAIQAVGQVHVNVRDLKRAVAFYRDVLGLRYLFEIPGSAFFDAGNLRLMIGVAEGLEHDHPASILYYRVPDIQAAFDAVKGAAKVEAEPHLIARMPDHELWMAFLRDPEDNLFALMSEVRAE